MEAPTSSQSLDRGMRTALCAVVGVLLGLAFSNTHAQDSVSSLDRIYRDETHCLVSHEIRSEKDKPFSCSCRDALTDARYVYQTYLLAGKDRNLNGTFLALQGFATQMCGADYDILHAAETADWRWNGPLVTRKYPTDNEIDLLRPDSSGWRTVKYEVTLVYPDPQRHPSGKVERFSAFERLPPKSRK
jgi:hypothetical protein